MFQPQSYGVVLTLMITTMLAWGSWANTMKMVPSFPFQLFYWDYVAGVVLVALLLGLTLGGGVTAPGSFGADLAAADGTAYLFAISGGVIFNVANVLLVAAIAVAGLAVAFPVGIGLALIVGVFLNYLIAPQGEPLLLFGGVALVLAAIVVDALAYHRRGGHGATDIARGLRLALACGVLMGSFYPLVARAMTGPGGLGPYAVAFVFSLGVLVCAIPVNIALMRKPITAEPPATFAQYRAATTGTHGWGLLGGAIWGTGTTLSFVAATTDVVGPAVSYAIGQGATMVSAAWGVFVWREFAGAPASARRLLPLMFGLFAAGLCLVAIAPLYGSG